MSDNNFLASGQFVQNQSDPFWKDFDRKYIPVIFFLKQAEKLFTLAKRIEFHHIYNMKPFLLRTTYIQKLAIGFYLLTLIIIIIIIIFCYSPKHCFRLFEGQQSTVGVKNLLRLGSNRWPLNYKASVFTIPPRNIGLINWKSTS